METRLKLTTPDQIWENEKKIKDELIALCEEYKPKFEVFGHELLYEFSRSSEDVDSHVDELTEPAEYKNEYNCRATVILRRPKTKEEQEKDAVTAEDMTAAAEEMADVETCSAEEMEKDIDLFHKAVAFSQIAITRIYRAFWVDKVILCDSTDSVREDLEEFLTRLTEKEADCID
ncbi:MAG: hypothetical protein KBS76_07490 [Ruminococcus sp.]|nr:hypothetical protein [Candidatus Apopatosoma intestinale]